MATLEEASRQLTEEIGEWESDVETATARFGALTKALAEREKALEAAVARLENEVSEFVGKVREEATTLQKAADEAHQAMSRAEAAVQGAGVAATGALSSAEDAVDNLSATLAELPEQVERIVARAVEEPSGQLADQARTLTDALETAFDTSGANLDAFTQAAAELQNQIPAASDGMGGAIKKSDEGVGEAFVEWTSHLFEVVDLVTKKGFTAVHANAKDVATYAAEETRKALTQETRRAAERAKALKGDLESVGDAVEQTAKVEVDSGLEEPLRTELEDLESAMGESEQWLAEIQQWLAGYSYMQG